MIITIKYYFFAYYIIPIKWQKVSDPSDPSAQESKRRADVALAQITVSRAVRLVQNHK
ncbi:hypothetical protein E24_00060 [Faustovirus]|nr:hypothetical protein E24_00060 [Faustovirus]AMN83980.1 hypothetical protein D5a_00060 [Faustovirus]AMN84963.1 hypothetical protein E23_00060 [Faustovirus]